MARLHTAGAEAVDLTIEGLTEISGKFSFDAGSPRSGKWSYKYNSGVSGGGDALNFSFTGVHGTDYYARTYLNVTNLPTNTAMPVLRFSDGAGTYEIRLNSDGTLQTNAGGNIGSASSAINTGQYYRLELRVRTSASASSSQVESRIDGVQLATSSTVNQTAVLTSYGIGTQSNNPGNNIVWNFDDLALNDSNAGGGQTSWPGDGKVVLLLPTSDNSAGSWKAGSAGSASSNGALYAGIDNTPPRGTASPNSVTACISNTVSGATNPNGDFNMTSYYAAGMQFWDTVNCVQMIIVHGEDIATNTKTGTFNIQSNPNTATDNVGDSGGNQFGPSASGAVGAYPGNNWVVQRGTVDYPTRAEINVGTAPVARITKTDTNTRAADCCFMGIYVDFTPGAYPGLGFRDVFVHGSAL